MKGGVGLKQKRRAAKFFGIFFANWRMALVAVVLCAASAYVLSQYVLEKHYISTAQIFVERTEEENHTAEEISASQQFAANVVMVLQSPQLYDRLNASLEGAYSPEQYRKMLDITREPGTQIIAIEADCGDPVSAFNLALTMTEISPSVIRDFMGYGVVKVVTSPDLPTSPAFPDVDMFTAVGALIGLALSLVGVLIIWLSDKTISPVDDITAEYNVPVFAEIVDFEARISDRDRY